MNTKRVLGIIFVGCGLFVGSLTLGHAVFYDPVDSNGNPTSITSVIPAVAHAAVDAVTKAPAQPLPGNWPSRLEIPSLSINAHVQNVGRGSTGNMAVPTNFTDVAWYREGAIPGDTGSAVIDGHVDNGLSLAGVFKHLSDIKVGDDVYIVNNKGAKLHFKVTDVQIYSKDAVPTNQVFNQTDGSYLNLITCDGMWVQDQKTYDSRLVVYTRLVE